MAPKTGVDRLRMCPRADGVAFSYNRTIETGSQNVPRFGGCARPESNCRSFTAPPIQNSQERLSGSFAAGANSHGFTLIELMIVLVIVAVIGLVVVHAFGMAKEKERFMSQCVEHEKEYQCEHKWKQMHPDPDTVVIYSR